MFLALREIRRGLVRFGLLALTIGLLLFLVLFQQALQQGLITAFVGGVRNQSAPVLVYAVDAQRALHGSVLTPDLGQQVLAVEGVGAHSRLGETTVSVRIGDDDDSTEASVIGTDGELGQPSDVADGRRPEAPNEAIGSSADFSVGETVTVLGAADDVEITVVGVADEVQRSVSPTLFTDFPTFEAAVRATNPDASSVPASALALVPADGFEPAELVERINDAVADADAATRDEAAETAPGVAQVSQSFTVIFGLYALVGPLRFDPLVFAAWAAAFSILSVIGAIASLLRVRRIDPVEAVVAGGAT